MKKSQGFIFFSPFLTPVGGRKKNVYWKVSVGLQCMQMSFKGFPHDCRIAETPENQLLSEIILLQYHQLQNVPSGKRLSTQSH